MSIVLEFLPEAKCDAEEATRFYERRILGLGARFRAEIESVCAAIVRQPLLWNERPGGYRRVNIPGFPYYVVYIIRNERIVVAAVGHAARHPDYWKRREF
ncbi:MAG: type II toxin-antitoxin system RelE/ParE family toxin [Opitutales bacterium]